MAGKNTAQPVLILYSCYRRAGSITFGQMVCVKETKTVIDWRRMTLRPEIRICSQCSARGRTFPNLPIILKRLVAALLTYAQFICSNSNVYLCIAMSI
jgi:hypothetical protein